MAWGWVQSAAPAPAASNVAVAYGTNLTAGTKLIAAVSLSSSQAGNVAISAVCAPGDGTNNMTFIGGVVNGTVGFAGLYAMDTPAGKVGTKPTITATFSATINNFGAALVIQEVSGLLVGNTTAMVDGTLATNSGNSAGPATTGAYSSTAVNEYLVAVYGDPGSGFTFSNPPAGYTADVNNPAVNGNAELGVDYKNSTGGAESASFTLGGSTPWETLLVAFQLAPAGVTSGPPTFPRPPARFVVQPFMAGRGGAGHS